AYGQAFKRLITHYYKKHLQRDPENDAATESRKKGVQEKKYPTYADLENEISGSPEAARVRLFADMFRRVAFRNPTDAEVAEMAHIAFGKQQKKLQDIDRGDKIVFPETSPNSKERKEQLQVFLGAVRERVSQTLMGAILVKYCKNKE